AHARGAGPLAVRLRRADQFAPTVAYGDAIGSDIFELQRLFWKRGVASEVYADEARPGVEPFVRPWHDLREPPRDGAALLVHVSMGNATLGEVARLPHRKAVVYHNITPAHFFEGISDQLVQHSTLGRDQLRELARTSELGIADSEFNRAELEALGFDRTAVVPILTDPSAFEVTPDAAVLAELADERTSILVAGQILPQKAILDVLEAFARYREGDREARLYLVGSHSMSGPYLERVREQIRSLDLGSAVRLTGGVPVEQYVAYFQGASALLTLSDHEGFCVPLLEAMRSGLPVVAHAAGAIPETLGDAGVLLEDKSPDAVAAALERVVRDAEHRADLVERGKRRLADFGTPRVAERLRDALALADWALPKDEPRSVTVLSSDQRCGIHHYALAVCEGLRANGHHVTFAGVRHLDTPALLRAAKHVARGDVVLVEHEAGIFRDVPFVRVLLDLRRRGHQVVLSLHELEPEKFHHYRMLSAALHYRPRFRWVVEALRIPWVALRIANWFVRYRAVLGLMGSLPQRLVVHSSRSGYWLDLLTHDARKRDEQPLVLMPLEDGAAAAPRSAEEKRELRRRLGLPLDRFVFVSPGFFFPRKRFLEVMAATPEDALLVLSGTRSEREPEYFDRVVAAAAERPNVHVNTDYDTMSDFVAAADAVVLWYEDVFQSAVVTQAIWAGLPLVLSAAPGFSTYHAAALVARDSEELRRHMHEIRDPETLARLGAGVSILRRMLAPERLAPRYLVGLD
ncbi:MAG: glycosyltransferase, partial [Candidatus Limnocylindria bacterium]